MPISPGWLVGVSMAVAVFFQVFARLVLLRRLLVWMIMTMVVLACCSPHSIKQLQHYTVDDYSITMIIS